MVADFLRFFFPDKCMFCRAVLTDGAQFSCAACAAETGAGSLRTALGGGLFFAGAVSPFVFDGAVRDALHRYKFSPSPALARGFAHYMYRALCDASWEKPDLITWVPGRASLKRKRGYDQTALLAGELWRASGKTLPRPAALLKKVKSTKAQYGLTPSERAANVMNAYRCISKTPLDGKTIWLVDDTLTTGATVSECARVLLMAGARAVFVITAAKTMKKEKRSSP